jgi:DNA-3-methyladenine glycosylase II
VECFELVPRGPFSLRAAAGFGFGPNEGRPPEFDGVLRYAFAVDGGCGYAGVELRQKGDDQPVLVTAHGDGDPQTVGGQVARVLSLDHDGDAFLEVGQRDAVIGGLQEAHRGVRPVLFFSPYEAAAWSVISARQRGIPAATVRRALCERLGRSFELEGHREVAFPGPEELLNATDLDIPGLNGEKQRRLREVAQAGAEGLLDASHLQSLGPDGAYLAVQRLRGIGPFYATLIVLRGSGFADALLPVAESKVLAHVAHFYGLAEPPTLERFAAMAEMWRPFRTWTTVLLRLAGDRAKDR